ncbi:MAG: hypothetical protein H8E55_03515 [Pelagibacterales bacterium]|nr:hypothetical protein [Pelagibacterales bacterium]
MMGSQILGTEDHTIQKKKKVMIKKIGKIIWAFVYGVGIVVGTICVFPIVLIAALIKVIGETLTGYDE